MDIRFEKRPVLKSKPEYGLNISAKNIPQLERFKLENMITAI